MLTDRRIAARQRKLASLESEFTSWENDSADGTRPLRLHHSQIGRITGVLRKLRSEIANPLAATGAAKTLTDRQVETTALELYRMWEFFRSKFAMRKVEWLRNYLNAVDDFALACYKPARDAAAAAGTVSATALKEPPLVFFGGGWSPFAMSRDFPFEAEAVPGAPVRNDAFKASLKKLPLPVVGIPWFQIGHLPDAVVVGHEVGHLVEDDLGLGATMANLIAGAADPSRQAAWRSWSGETFGDFYGQLATGPAFVGALAEALSDDPTIIAKEKINGPAWSAYPTTYLRMKVNFAMLRAQNLSAAADALEAEWQAAYGATHNMAAFDADAKPIADALRDTAIPQLGNKTLPDVLSFATVQDECDVAVRRLEATATPAAGNVRALVAAAGLFFAKSPGAYDDVVQKRVLDVITLSIPQGVRGTRAKSPAQAEAEATLTDELIALIAGTVTV
jgi:hypothetical protein